MYIEKAAFLLPYRYLIFYFIVMHILVSNLSLNIIDDDLQKLFSLFGEVSYSAVVRDRKTGRSKGRAFVEMPFEAQAQQAIAALNGTEWDGTEITVQKIESKAGEFNN